MADRVQLEIERMVPELQHLVQQKLFSLAEIRDVVKQRTQHEYNIIRRTPYLSDFFRYIQYEVKIELTRRRRQRFQSAKWKALRKPGISDYSILGRTFRIFNAALMKFPNNIALWFQLIDWALALKSFGQLSRIFLRALRFHPLSTQLWHRAAMYEFEIVGNVENARVYFQRGLRLNSKALDLWYGFFTMELSYIGRIAKRHILSNVLPSVERQEQYDRFVNELQQFEQQQQQQQQQQKQQALPTDQTATGQQREKEILHNASLLPWTPENSSGMEPGDKLLLSGRIAQAIYDNACKQFKIADGITVDMTGLGSPGRTNTSRARGLSVKQKLGFLALVNSWKAGREERGVDRARTIDQDARNAHVALKKELAHIAVSERCLALAGIDISALYQHILLDIFDTIHSNVAAIPDLSLPGGFNQSNSAARHHSDSGSDSDSDSDSSSNSETGTESDSDDHYRDNDSNSDDDDEPDRSDDDDDDDRDQMGPDPAAMFQAQVQQQIDLYNALDKPIVDRDDIGAFWDCFARLSLYCEDLQFEVPVDLLAAAQRMAPASRQFSLELDFPAFPAVLPQLDQRALTRYLFGIKIYASYPALAHFIPLVLGKLTQFLYRRIKHYFSALTSPTTATVLSPGTEQYQHLYSIGYAMTSFLESVLAWAQFNHARYVESQRAQWSQIRSDPGRSATDTSIPWVSSEMLSYWLKLKLLVVGRLPIYPPHAKPALYTTNSLPKFDPLNGGERHTHGPTTTAATVAPGSGAAGPSADTVVPAFRQEAPTSAMLQHRTLYDVFSIAIHYIRQRVVQHNSDLAQQLVMQHRGRGSSGSGSGGRTPDPRGAQRSIHYYDEPLENLVSLVYTAYVNFVLRPHLLVPTDNQQQDNVTAGRTERSFRRAVLDAYTTLLELHTTVMSSHFIDPGTLSREDQAVLFERLGASLSTSVNTRPLFSFSSLGLYWKTFLQLHDQLLGTAVGDSPASTARTAGQCPFLGSLSTNRLHWLHPAIATALCNSKFFYPYTTAITAVQIRPDLGGMTLPRTTLGSMSPTIPSSSHPVPSDGPSMADICLFMHLAALHFFQLIKQGYITQGTNVFIPTASTSHKVSRYSLLDVLNHAINTFKAQAVQFCTKLISNLSLVTILGRSDPNLVPPSASTSVVASTPGRLTPQTLHARFKLDQERLLAQTVMGNELDTSSSSDDDNGDCDGSSSSSDSDSESDHVAQRPAPSSRPKADQSKHPTSSTVAAVPPSLNTLQHVLEFCMSAIYSPHSAYTYNACLQAFVNIYKQKEAQFAQFNVATGTNGSDHGPTLSQQQAILLQLQHRVRKLFLHASRDVGGGDMWIWIHYAQFLHYLQQRSGKLASSSSGSKQQASPSHALELVSELGSVQQNAIKMLDPSLRSKFVSTIDALLHK